MNYVSLVLSNSVRRCIVDEDTAEAVKRDRLTLFAATGRCQKQYVTYYQKGSRKSGSLHRRIMGDPPNYIDHINGDTFDCRRSNLRHSSPQENSFNQSKIKADNRSGIACVAWFQNRWVARVANFYIGRFYDVRDAVECVWLAKLSIDPAAATNYLRTLPPFPPKEVSV